MINTSNLCIFEGRIAREPQCSNITIGQDSVEKAIFTIAVDRALSSAQRQKVKNGDGSIKTTDFIPCSLLGAKVAVLKQYFPVGKSIKVIGHYTEYQTTDQQTGQKKYGHIFEIDEIGFTTQDSKNLQQNNNQTQNNYQQNNNTYQQPQQQPVQNGFAMFDEGAAPF
jgi:single-strand DNA-binding protein